MDSGLSPVRKLSSFEMLPHSEHGAFVEGKSSGEAGTLDYLAKAGAETRGQDENAKSRSHEQPGLIPIRTGKTKPQRSQ